LLVALVIGCSGTQENSSDTEVPAKVIPAQVRVVSPDSSMNPVIIPLDWNKLNHSGIPEHQAMRTNMNVVPLKMPEVLNIITPQARIMGTDTFDLPETVVAKPEIVIAQQPKPVNSLPLRMKDGASYNIQYLDVDQGMNSSYVWDIFEDQSGNLWFATDGGGVTKYDGKSFLHFTEEQGLISNYVRKIIQDKSGNLWFGTINGISRYDGVTFTNYGRNSGIKHNSIWGLLEASDGKIWVSSYGGGVSSFDGTNFVHYTTEQGLSDNMVWSICEGDSGTMWLGTNGSGICKIDGKEITNYSMDDGLPDNTIVAIERHPETGVLYLASQRGLVLLSGKSGLLFSTEHGLSSNSIRSIYLGDSATVWLGTYGSGMMRLQGNEVVRLGTDEGLSDGHIVSMEKDASSNIWLATYGGGVCKYNPRSFQHFTDKQNLTNYFVWSVVQDSSGRMWFGTNGGGVFQYFNSTLIQFTSVDGLCSNIIRTVCCMKDGSIWLGSYGGGITCIKGDEFIQITESDGLCSNSVLHIMQNRDGKVWIATDGGGVSVYDGTSFANYTTAQGLPSNYIRAMMQDSKGRVWLGSHAGLCSYNPEDKTITRYNEADQNIGLSSLWCVSEDNSGGIWFGTGGYGAARYFGSDFTFYSDQQGLSNNSVWSMVKDGEGRIWMGTEKGLNCITLTNDSVTISPFHREDGLKAEDFYLKSAFLDQSNHLWWGTGKALTTLDLDRYQVNTAVPKLQLNQVFIREEFIDYRALKSADSALRNREYNRISFDSTADFTNLPQNLQLPYSLNHLTFYFSATEWSAPHSVRYEYKLDGLDPSWSQPTAENKADYRNIPYGEYTFRVRAVSASRQYSNEIAYVFTVHPPWWHTWWARTIGVLVVIALIYSYMRYRERALQARQKELQTKVNEATYEIKHQKNLIEEKHKAITDSINYAERIQRSFLATKELLDVNLKEYFVLYLPKDVVSGDFYWASKLNDGHFALVTADSTGHGVPGAIMSLLNITSLEKAVEHETDPAKILYHTRRNIIERLSKDGTKDGGWDGMDCSIISFHPSTRKMRIAAANNPVWIIRGGVLHEIKADRYPVGKHQFDTQPFTNHDFDLQSGDMIYTMTDGYADQFGGPLGKKFKWKQLQKVLQQNASYPMDEQKQRIGDILHSWKSELEQIDDICLIGIRIS
jgi:ligand-binding sensor domain-containing protein/serine phosphatase RsbU (regulator of sigma subunit)